MPSSGSDVVGTTAAASDVQHLVDNALCCAQWTSRTGHVGRLTCTSPASSCQISCKIAFDRARHQAIFRLTVPGTVRDSGNETTHLYVYVHPQDIHHLQRLALDDSEPTQACINDLVSRSKLCQSSSDIIALQFLLKQPATVIGPSESPASIEPRSTGSGKILECLHSLLFATNLTIFLPKTGPLVESIDELCTSASNGTFQSTLERFKVSSLYRGVGGVDIGALLGRFSAHQPPAYPDVTSRPEHSVVQSDTTSNQRTPHPDVRPPTSVSGPALGKRKRADQEQEEGPVPTRAWIERMEEQQSELCASVALLHAGVADIRRERERGQSAAPLTFSYARPVTRSVSARPESAALDEVQCHLQQMNARLGAVEQQQRVHNESAAGQAPPAPPPEPQQHQQQQQRPPTMPLPDAEQTAGIPPPRELLPPNPALRQPNSSPHTPWSQFSDAERLNALEEAAADEAVDSDEEAAAAHAEHEAARALAQRRLFAELVTWLRAARSLGAGRNVHAHPDERLRTRFAALGRFAGAGNVAAFAACSAWCLALLFCLHGGAGAGAAEEEPLDARRLVADVAGLVRWANERRHACVVCVEPVRDDFARLGAAARATTEAVAAEGEGGDRGKAAMEAYERQRDVCVARVLTLSSNERR